MAKPLAHVLIDDLSTHVCTTLRRCSNRLGSSLIDMTGGLLRHCLRKHLAGQLAHPGKAKMAHMGRCCERQVKRNLRQLEAWGVMIPVADLKGGHRATRYRLDLEALKPALVFLGTNPSPELFEKIDAVSRRLRSDARGDSRGDIRRDIVSPGITESPRTSQAKAMRVAGGRDA